MHACAGVPRRTARPAIRPATHIAHPATRLGPQAFAGRAVLPTSAVWPASEFGGCGGGLAGAQGQLYLWFYGSDTGSNAFVASW